MIKIISHRGNLNGCYPLTENHPTVIEYLLQQLDYDIEVDVRVINDKIFLGHDTPEYEVDINYLLSKKDRLWIHCKTKETYFELSKYKQLRIFLHDLEIFTVTSLKEKWTADINYCSNSYLVLMPDFEIHNSQWTKWLLKNVNGICTDYPMYWQKEFERFNIEVGNNGE